MPVLVGFAQSINNDDLTADFFYGTWTDSTKVGMILTKKNIAYHVRDKKPKTGFDEIGLNENEVSWNYNLLLDRRPIIIEFTCRQCDGKLNPGTILGQIEIINCRQINLTFLDQNGAITETALLTKK